MIDKLYLDNFKSWVDTEIPFSKLTGFWGPNSSGKTSILQFLLLLKQSVESRNTFIEFGNDKTYVELGGFKDVIHNHDMSSTLRFLISWFSQEAINTYLEAAEPSNSSESSSNPLLQLATQVLYNKSAIVPHILSYFDQEQHYTIAKEGKDYVFTIGKGGKSIESFDQIPTPPNFYEFSNVIKKYENSSIVRNLEQHFQDLIDNIHYLGPLRAYPERQYLWQGNHPINVGKKGEYTVPAILNAKISNEKYSSLQEKKEINLEAKIVESLQTLGLIHSFRTNRISPDHNYFEVLVKKNPNSQEVLLTDVGFGVSQVLPVITLCYYVPKGSIIILEQPEIHLHPSIQAGLADVLIDAIKTRDIQIILESHSEHLLRRLQRRIAEEKFDPKDANLFFCENNDNKSSLMPLEINEFGNIINWPKDFFGDSFGEISAMKKAIVKRRIKLRDAK